MQITNSKVIYDCGCEFDIASKDPLRIKFVPDFESINKDCSKTWDLISSGNTKGIFQLESQLGQHNAKQLKPRCINDLSALITIIRPGCLEAKLEDGRNITQHYIDRKNGLEAPICEYSVLEPILQSEQNLLLYQEQILQIAREIAGFTYSESEVLRKCVSGNSLMMTDSGPRYIKDLSKKKTKYGKLLSFNEQGKLVYNNITNVWSNGIKSVYRLRTWNGFYIDATEGHQFLTQDGWKELKDITDKDFVYIASKYVYKGSSKKLTKNLAILCGYFLSEGCLSPKTRNCPKISNKDPEIIEKIKKLIIDEFGESCYGIYYDSNNVAAIYFRGKARRFFIDNFKPARSYNKEIPAFITNSYGSLSTAFVGSYFDGDGTTNKSSIEISTRSRDMAKKLQLLLLRDGIFASLHKKKSTFKYKGIEKPFSIYSLYISNRSDIAKFRNTYKEYISQYKLDRIDAILSTNYSKSFNSFLVPSKIIQSVASVNNFSGILPKEYTSGSVYTQNLTYDKVALLNKYLGSDLLKDILEQEFKFVRVKSIKYLKDEEVFDFSLENEPHAGFVNGILTHNSIGKKRADIMAKVKDQFIEGCIKTGKVTKEEAISIFSWIEKNSRYGFNRSHAIGYAANSYLSAYAKAHFKYAFFTSYLFYAKDKQGKYDEIKDLVANAKVMEVDVRPPSFQLANKNFGHIGNKIHFGISDIKGVGESTYANVVAATYQGTSCLNKSREELTWLEFLLFCSPGIKSVAVEGLIESGALDFMRVDRQRMLFEYRQFNELTKNEILWLTQNFKNNNSLLEMLRVGISSPNLGKRGSFCLNTRIAKINSIISTIEKPPTKVKDNAAWLCSVEEARLGTSLTASAIDGCKGLENANCNCLDFVNGNCRSTGIFLAAEIAEVKPYTCSNGKTMAFIKARDTQATIDCCIFAEQLDKYYDLLVPGNTVMLSGDKSKRGRESLVIKNVWQLT